MLNRRILRMRAVQSYYAFKQCQEANYELAQEKIRSFFEPNLNAEVAQDRKELAYQAERGVEVFKRNYKLESIGDSMGANPKVLGSVTSAINFYRQQNQKDADYLRRYMLDQAEGVYTLYIMALSCLVELADFIEEDYALKRKRSQNQVIGYDFERKFNQNEIIKRFRKHSVLKKEVENRHIRWEKTQLHDWYKLLLKDDLYVRYQQSHESNFEQDYLVVEHLIKRVIVEHRAWETYFEDYDLNWSENKAVVKNMLVNTLKDISRIKPETENADGNLKNTEIELQLLSRNWQDDKQFFKDLFVEAIRGEEDLEPIIADKVKNWDIERLLLVDKVIIQLALTEMVHFPSIPVKVTINEFLEIAKEYSAPHSFQFINGVLDSSSKEMLVQGKIRKSGRGLIDTK